MKKLALAALLAMSAIQADASVIISFKGDASLSSYLRSYVGGNSVQTDDAGVPRVSGKIVIDTHAAGPNLATPPAIFYDGAGAPFLSGSFASTGTTPTLQSSGTPYNLIDADPDAAFGYATIEFDFENQDVDGTLHSSTFRFGSASPVPLGKFGGITLPDFSQASDVYFEVTSRDGTNDNYVERVSSGYASQISVSVPEPMTWATMIAGLGMVGGAMRVRRRATVAA